MIVKDSLTVNSLRSNGSISGNSLTINGTGVIDSNKNIAGNSLTINGTGVIDSDRNITGFSLTINGTSVINSDRHGAFIQLQSSTAPSTNNDVIRKYEWDRAYLNKIAQFSSLPLDDGTYMLTYHPTLAEGQRFSYANIDYIYYNVRVAGFLAVIAAIGSTLAACNSLSTETITLGVNEAIIIYNYDNSGSITLSGGYWAEEDEIDEFPCMIIPRAAYTGNRGAFRVITVYGDVEPPVYYTSNESISITFKNARHSLYYKKFTLIP